MDELLRIFLERITGIPLLDSRIPDEYYAELVEGRTWSQPMSLALRSFPQLSGLEELEELLLTLPPLAAAAPPTPSSPVELLLTRLSGTPASDNTMPPEWSDPLIEEIDWTSPNKSPQ